MPFNLVLLPLLAGYYFLHRLYLTKFRAQTLSGYRILLESALAGAVFLIVARCIVCLVGLSASSAKAIALFKVFAPFPFTGTAVLSLVLSWFVVLAVNSLGDKGVAAFRAYRKYGGEFLALILRVQVGDENGPFALMVTLKNRKVYTGFVLAAPTPAQEHQHIKILPSASGYRDDDKLTVHWTNYYGGVYDRLRAGEFSTKWNEEDHAIVIPVDEILTSTRFVEEIPPEAFASAGDRPAPPPPTIVT